MSGHLQHPSTPSSPTPSPTPAATFLTSEYTFSLGTRRYPESEDFWTSVGQPFPPPPPSPYHKRGYVCPRLPESVTTPVRSLAVKEGCLCPWRKGGVGKDSRRSLRPVDPWGPQGLRHVPTGPLGGPNPLHGNAWPALGPSSGRAARRTSRVPCPLPLFLCQPGGVEWGWAEWGWRRGVVNASVEKVAKDAEGEVAHK